MCVCAVLVRDAADLAGGGETERVGRRRRRVRSQTE